MNGNKRLNNALDYVKTSCDFVLEEDRIRCHYVSGLSIILFLLVFILVLYVFVYFNTKYRAIDIDVCFIAFPIVFVVGALFIVFVQTNKVIDAKNKQIYSELLIFGKLIFRYHFIKGDEILEVGNNTRVTYGRKCGCYYLYYTSLLLNNGTIYDLLEFSGNYGGAYNLAVVIAHYLNKPLFITSNSQQLVISAGIYGLRLSSKQLKLKELTNVYMIKHSIISFVVFMIITFVYWFFMNH